jgi:circadian clock protein KaiB
MNSQPSTPQDDGSSGSAVICFRLYIAAGAPNSLRAVANLRTLCEKYLPGRYQIETVDVLQDPLRALNDHVLVTPTLIKITPEPQWEMTGDLSATGRILLALGISEKSHHDE